MTDAPQTPSPPPESPQTAPQTPEPSSPPARPDPVSVGSSKVSSAGRFTVDPGPAFDADGRPESPQPDPTGEQLVEVPDLWDERRVAQLLQAKGLALHALVAVDKQSGEWVYTQNDLAAIAPPLTAILNRYEPTRAAAHAGDELALIVGLASYTGRSIMERRTAIAAMIDTEPVPITGMPAEHGPQDDPDWQREHGVDPDSTPAPIRRPGR